MPTAVYDRISSDDEKDAHGVFLQRKQNLAFCKTAGLDLPAQEHRFMDNDVSAYRNKARPDFDKLMTLAQDGQLTDIVVRDWSRLQRNLTRFAQLLDVCAARGITIHTLRQGAQAPGQSKLQAVIFGTLAEEASREKSEWIKAAALEKAMRGERSGRQRVYGWRGHEVIPEQAAVVREIAARIAGGDSPSRIARDLTARGERSNNMIIREQDGKEPTTSQWNASSVARLVLRPANVGLMEHNGQILEGVVAQWPAILDMDEWKAACHMLNRPERKSGRTNRRKHLMSGLMTCGVCEHPMVSGVAMVKGPGDIEGRRSSTRPTYRCPNGCLIRHAHNVDAYIREIVIGVLSREDAVVLLTDGSDEAAEAVERAALLRQRRAQVTSEFDIFKGSVADLVAIQTRLDEEIAAAEEIAATANEAEALRGIIASQDAEAFWNQMVLGERREVIRCLLDIRVLPSHGGGSVFRPELVEVGMRRGPQMLASRSNPYVKGGDAA